MAVFAVHISGPSPETAIQRIEEKYPGTQHYKASERLCLVRADAIARSVADALGMYGPDGSTGVVFKLNAAYAGFENPAIWEWLQLADTSQ